MEVSRLSVATDARGSEHAGGIAIVVLTHNRVHLLRKCVESVLGVTSPATREIVIWNNGSSDGTRDYLDALEDPRITVVHNETNIGQNAYARAFDLTSSDYLVELDDDVVDAPPNWDAILRDAYRRLPSIGFAGIGPVSQYGVSSSFARLNGGITPSYYWKDGVPAYSYNVDSNGLPNVPASISRPTSNSFIMARAPSGTTKPL